MSQTLRTSFIHLSLFIVLALILSACNQSNPSKSEIEDAWGASPHNDTESRSFTHWDGEDPPEIPSRCAKCHSTPGYLDYLGADGSTPGQVDQPPPTGTTIECDVCHNQVAEVKDFVIMPSGLEIVGLGQESNCMECHQGRASASQVFEVIAGQPRDTVNEELSLPNIHNNAAGATFYGAEARGGAEYIDHRYSEHENYIQRFYHGFDNCTTCHNPHTLQVNVKNCSACHLGADTLAGVRKIRLSKLDYDGDGDFSEGLSGEIETMQEKLLFAIQVYAGTTEGVEHIEYNGRFVDQDGEVYTTWTPALLQAAYNYQYADLDPGEYSHNAKYIMQLLYDSIEDLGGSTRGMLRPSPD